MWAVVVTAVRCKEIFGATNLFCVYVALSLSSYYRMVRYEVKYLVLLFFGINLCAINNREWLIISCLSTIGIVWKNTLFINILELEILIITNAWRHIWLAYSKNIVASCSTYIKYIITKVINWRITAYALKLVTANIRRLRRYFSILFLKYVILVK